MNRFEKFLVDTKFGQRIIHRSKHILLPGFHKLPLYDVFVFFVQQIRRSGLNERASSISFSFLLAIPAGTIFLCTLIPYLPIAKQVTSQLLELVKDYTINQNTYVLIKNFLDDFLTEERTGLLSLGFLLVIFYASNAMMGIMRTFDKSLVYAARRNFLVRRWTAIRLTIILMFFILLTIILLSLQGPVLNWLLKVLHLRNTIIPDIFPFLRWITIVALVYYSIAVIYKYAPAVHKRWKLSSPGTNLATFLIVTTTAIFSFWVNHFGNFNKIYGSIGTILIIMTLVYFNSLVLLIGYELNVSIHHLKHQADERARREKA